MYEVIHPFWRDGYKCWFLLFHGLPYYHLFSQDLIFTIFAISKGLGNLSPLKKGAAKIKDAISAT